MMSTDLEAQFAKYKFYHCIDLGNGMVTPGWKEILPVQEPVTAEIAKQQLRGKRVLDIGCRDGLFSFQAERQGADYVLVIDSALSLAALELLIPWFNSKVEMREANINDFTVAPDERFDFVIFAGVLYHLRTPFLALRRIADAMKPGATMVLETAIMLNHHEFPFLYCPTSDESPYDKSSVTFFNHLGLVAALQNAGFSDIISTAIVFASRRYASWQDVLTSTHERLARSKKVVIGRGTYSCKFTGADPVLSQYWFSTREPTGATGPGRAGEEPEQQISSSSGTGPLAGE